MLWKIVVVNYALEYGSELGFAVAVKLILEFLLFMSTYNIFIDRYYLEWCYHKSMAGAFDTVMMSVGDVNVMI